MSTAAEFFEELMRGLPQLEREILKDIVLVEASRFHNRNFRDGGFTDQGFQPWEPRKKPDPKRKLLVKKGNMRRSATKGEAIGNKAVFVLPEDYMRVHNEGGRAGRGEGFQMPKRQFIGESAELARRIQQKATWFLNKKFK